MSLMLALVASLSTAAIAVLFVTMWGDGDGVTTVVLAFALLATLTLAIAAWRVTL
ncbi:MAG TPA: hypothetical protein VFI90_05015 [Rubrobacter sp.]|nr:hypothetical protein [Rubrobacter sp.]